MQRIENLLSILISTFIIVSTAHSQQNLCGDYAEFRDVKCFKLLAETTVDTHENAIDICKRLTNNNSSTLVSIASKEEQDFVERLIRDGKVKTATKIWLGAERSAKNKTEFVWQDSGTSVTSSSFANWYANDSGKEDCVEVSAEESTFGKWITAPCMAKNAIMCQFTQFGEMKKLFNDLQRQVNSVKTEVNSNLANSPVPIGFIYTQFPNQSEPAKLWPTVNWTDVSSQYAGLFFRVLGANSSGFNVTQEESSPRLESVEWHFTANNIEYDSPVSIPANGAWSKYIFTAGHTGDYDFIRFKLSSGEVRPRNQAIKLWKRTA